MLVIKLAKVSSQNLKGGCPGSVERTPWTPTGTSHYGCKNVNLKDWVGVQGLRF